jgi:hypothetical protein
MDVDTTLIRIFADGTEFRSTCPTADYRPVVRVIVDGHKRIVQEIVEKPSVLEPKKFKNEVWVTVREQSSTPAQA